MKIIVDVMSGDHAPLELIRGALLARKEYGEEIILVGDQAVIQTVANENRLDLTSVKIVHAPSVIGMEEHALSVVREKNDSSMSIGLHLLATGDGDAFVCAGNTGALVAGSTLIVRRIKKIERAGIATVLPFPTPCLLMDSGANLEITPTNMEQFAFMGSTYMKKMLRVTNPRVGLINNGSEPSKGTEVMRQTFIQLSDADMNFVGNIEGCDIPFGRCDVLLTDGFTGNVLLKYTEGMGKFMFSLLKDMFSTNMLTRLSAASMKGKLREVKHEFDASEYGGAPILGISKPVIKAHGSSDASAVKNAIGQAIAFYHSGIIRDIAVFAIDHEDRMKQRAKMRVETQKAREKAEKLARKQKRSMNETINTEDEAPNDGV